MDKEADQQISETTETTSKPKSKVKNKTKAKLAAQFPRRNLGDDASTEERSDLLYAARAWSALEQHRRQSWDDWLLVGRGLAVAQSVARRWCGNSNKRSTGPRYNKVFSDVMDQAGLTIEKNARAKLLHIMQSQPEITAWRDGLPEDRRDRLNHPVIVLREFRKSQQPVKVKPQRPNPATLLAIARAQDEVREKALSRVFEFAHAEGIDLPISEALVDDEIKAATQVLMVTPSQEGLLADGATIPDDTSASLAGLP